DEQWNRGAYLAEGIGHCGACHSPRNGLGAEIRGQQLDGGEVEGWHAYAINARSQSQESWNADALHTYLRKGWHDQHGIAHGPMAPVTRNLAAVADADVRAIATYVASMTDNQTRSQRADTAADPASNDAGAAIYAASCESCHDGTRPLPFGGMKLAL